LALATLAVGAALALTASLALPATAKTGIDPVQAGGPVAAAPAFPTFVQLPADQAAHPDAPWEWWYIVGHVDARDHRFGYEVQIISNPVPQALIAITDKTTGEFFTKSLSYTPDQTAFSTTELDLRTPAATLSGPMHAMRLHATLPVGEIDLTLSARGPAMYNNGTGLIPFLDGTSYHYSLPSLATRGTLEVSGRTYAVAGQSWLDRQWGSWDFKALDKWTWMALQLSNGDRLNLWNVLLADGREHSYATVLHPNGTHQIVAVSPLAEGTSDFWTSPDSGKVYGTRWRVSIPALDAKLTVVADPREQELLTDYGNVYEGASTVTGRYRGRPIGGQAYVEQLGNWR
jgi:predicted secreted hydrolase